MSNLAWHWRLHPDPTPEEIAEVPGAHTYFPSQSEAETWLGESWRDLRDAGVESVSLLEDDRVVYGPMGLDA